MASNSARSVAARQPTSALKPAVPSLVLEGWSSGEILSWYLTNGSSRHGAPNLGKVASIRSPSSSYRRRVQGPESSSIIRVSLLNNRSTLREGGKQTIGSRYENIWPRSG